MSKDTKKKKTATARPLNRWRLGMHSTLQLLFLLLAVLFLNYLSLNHFKRIDTSRDRNYTLSSLTRNYLASPAVTGRKPPVRMILAYRRSSPFYERVKALAEEYARHSGGAIQLTLVDPMRDADRMEEINSAYGISLVRDLILIDARSDQSAVTTENEQHIKQLNPHIKIVPAGQMVAWGMVNEQRKIIGFQGEEVITAKLVEAIEGKPRKMALIADKSRIGSATDSPERKTLEELLRLQNVELSEIQINTLDKIDESIDGLLIHSPRYDFSEKEILVLEEYWQRPKSSVLVMIGEEPVPTNLRIFLRKQGITPQGKRLIGMSQQGAVTSARASFTSGIPFTAELAGQATEFGGTSTSLEVREGDEDLINRRINPMSLLEVAEGFWAESNFGQGQASFDPLTDLGAPLHMAACVTRGAESDDRFAAESSRMVVIANTAMLQPEHHRAANLDFLVSSINWLVGRDQLTGITPHGLNVHKLPLLQAQISFINRCNLIFMPLALLLIGGFIWSSRRA